MTMLASTRSNPGQNACEPRPVPELRDVLAVQRPPARCRAARRSRPRPRTCARSGARTRPGRAARAPSRRRRRGSSRTRRRRSRAPASRARSRRSRSRSARTPTSRGTAGCSGRSAGRSRGARAARAAAPSSGTRASAPISPPSPSIRLPTTAAATIAPSATGSESASPYWSSGQDEERARDDHEQRDRQVRPEQEAVERAEHPQPLRNRLDPPRRRFDLAHCALPSPA